MKPEKLRRMAVNKKGVLSRSMFFVLGLSVLFSSVSSGMIPAGSEIESGQVEYKKLSGVLKGGGATLTSVDSSSAFWYGGGFLIRTSQKIGLEITIERFSLDVREDLGGLGTGKLNVTPLLLSGQWRFLQGPVMPYASLGAGFYFFDYVPDHVNPDEGHDSVVSDRFALHLGGGVDIKVLSGLVLFGELRYSLIKTWVQERSDHHADPADQDMLRLDTLFFGVGIRYHF